MQDLPDTSTPLPDAALIYARNGLPVFPLREREKVPAHKGGFHNATINAAVIRRIWRAKSYNIGIPTGAASQFTVLDVDMKEGINGALTLEHLQDKNEPLPPTLESITGTGRQYWFRYVDGLRNSAGKLGEGLDIRGDGGYAVVAPSVHPNGNLYQWTNTDVPIAVMPGWLVSLARAPKVKNSERAMAAAGIEPLAPRWGDGRGYGQAALRYEVEQLATTPKGGRNTALNRASFVLHQLVAGGELGEAEVEHGLQAACLANGLIADEGQAEVMRTLGNGKNAGLLLPRTRAAR